jgi:hypothetical protein
MVPPILFIIFVLFFRACNGIKCVDDTHIQLSSSELTLINIQHILNDLKYSNRMKCQVYIEFDSIAEKLMIKFGASMELPRIRSVENVYINIVTSMRSVGSEKNSNQTSISTKMYLVCYNDDACDRQLILEHFDWLIKTNYKNLESTIRPLILVQSDKKGTFTNLVIDKFHESFFR